MYTGGINIFENLMVLGKGWGGGWKLGEDRASVYNVCTCDRVSICKGII